MHDPIMHRDVRLHRRLPLRLRVATPVPTRSAAARRSLRAGLGGVQSDRETDAEVAENRKRLQELEQRAP
jgi:hypothetical protein